MEGHTHEVRRAGDMLVATLRLTNLEVSDDGFYLRVSQPGEAYATLELPTQHLAEPGFDDVVPRPRVVPLVAGSRTSLRFTPPTGRTSFPIGHQGVLAVICSWQGSRVSGNVEVLSTMRVGAPGRWRFSDTPDTSGVHPLWSARPDYPRGTALLLYGRSEHPYTDIVLPIWIAGHRGIVLSPPAIDDDDVVWSVSRMLLSSLGGTVTLEGPIDPYDATPAMGYAHRTSLGRDAFARRITTGHLSSGHPASVTDVSERLLRRVEVDNRVPGGPPETMMTAGLRMLSTLMVTEPTVDLSAQSGVRSSALTSLTIVGSGWQVDSADFRTPQWLERGGTPIMFDMVGTDHGGSPVHLRMPLAFFPAGTPAEAAERFVRAGAVPAPTMAPQRIRLTPDEGASARTTVLVSELRSSPVRGSTCPIVPKFDRMGVEIDALEGIVDHPPTGSFVFHSLYDAHGLDPTANPHGAFLSAVSDTGAPSSITVELPGAAIGGLANPGLSIGALTTQAGAVARELVAVASPDVSQIRSAFAGATLFGGLKLTDLLAEHPFGTDGGRTVIPSMLRRRGHSGDTIAYSFSARLRQDAPRPAVVQAGSTLELTATLTRSLDGQYTTVADGTISGIGFNLSDAITLQFAKVHFRTEGGVTTFEVEGVSVTFGKELGFVATLADELSHLGQGGGVRTDVDTTGVTAGFGLALPNVAAGVVQFSNLTIDAWLRLPFDGGPLCFSLQIASRERPFLATVSMFGGGGWLALGVTPQGIVSLELGIEFGGSMSLDIVVASGGVAVMAGFYLGVGVDEAPLKMEAYLRASGFVSVLGVVTVFVEFVLKLTYTRLLVNGVWHGALIGAASVTVGVEVLFFSKSVTLPFSRTFVGAPADPSFLDCIDEHDWDVYCDAYAVEPRAAVDGER